MNSEITHRRWTVEPPKQPAKTAKILIVDDDVDAALLVDSIFAHLGCQTTCTMTASEARQKIYSLKADIIILDWCLEHPVDAPQLVKQCTENFSRYGAGEKRRKPLVVTYSALDASEIALLKTPYFDHIDHWQKPLAHGELLSRALGLLTRVGP